MFCSNFVPGEQSALQLTAALLHRQARFGTSADAAKCSMKSNSSHFNPAWPVPDPLSASKANSLSASFR